MYHPAGVQRLVVFVFYKCITPLGLKFSHSHSHSHPLYQQISIAIIGVKNTPMTAFRYFKTVNLIQASTGDV
jgi:hypothetical protein